MLAYSVGSDESLSPFHLKIYHKLQIDVYRIMKIQTYMNTEDEQQKVV